MSNILEQFNLMTVQQAADELHVSARTIQHWIKGGKVKAHQIGDGRTSAFVIEVSEVERIRSTSRPAYAP